MKEIWGSFSFELFFVLWLFCDTDAEVLLSAPECRAGGRTSELTGLLLFEIMDARFDWERLTISGWWVWCEDDDEKFCWYCWKPLASSVLPTLPFCDAASIPDPARGRKPRCISTLDFLSLRRFNWPLTGLCGFYINGQNEWKYRIYLPLACGWYVSLAAGCLNGRQSKALWLIASGASETPSRCLGFVWTGLLAILLSLSVGFSNFQNSNSLVHFPSYFPSLTDFYSQPWL